MNFRHRRLLVTLALVVSLPLAAAAPAAAALLIDGRLDEPQWSDARVVRDFVVTAPYTLGKPRLATEARILATEQGLAVALICEHPPGEARTRTLKPRDADGFDADSVLLMVDFEGQGKVGYEFAVSITNSYRDATITNENEFNSDWDGLWQHAVREEEERWTVEYLLPWSIATMRDGDGPTRQIGVFFSRYHYARGERAAWPGVHYERERFLSQFERIEVPRYRQSQLDVMPYATALADLVDDRSDWNGGLDLFWRPNGSLLLAATLNPDFGQVESDDLIIDFSAIETFFSDKRPFFTENQGIFDLRMPNDGYHVYTRRIGGPSDVDGTASDIDGALKVIGGGLGFDYGVFAAEEADTAGRTFAAARLDWPRDQWSVGYLGTWVDRPFLDRTAQVNTIDYDLKPTAAWRIRGQLSESRVEEGAGAPAGPADRDGVGAWALAEYRHSARWRYALELLRFDADYELNDLGYLERNDLEQATFDAKLERTGFGAASATDTVTWNLIATARRNTAGSTLTPEYELERVQIFKGGTQHVLELTYEGEGVDDLISRGNGDVQLEPRWSVFDVVATPRIGRWRSTFGVWAFQEGIDDWAVQLEPSVAWFATESLTLDLDLWPRRSREWLIWLEGNRLATFERRQLLVDLGANWFPAPRHEVRLRAQWLTLDAKARQVYEIGPGGRLVPVAEATEDFAVLNFGLQLRYRYEIAPLSDVFVVYSRGGLESIEQPREGQGELFSRATELRDADQLLVKLRYRF